jgi:Trp operon repressor
VKKALRTLKKRQFDDKSFLMDEPFQKKRKFGGIMVQKINQFSKNNDIKKIQELYNQLVDYYSNLKNIIDNIESNYKYDTILEFLIMRDVVKEFLENNYDIIFKLKDIDNNARNISDKINIYINKIHNCINNLKAKRETLSLIHHKNYVLNLINYNQSNINDLISLNCDELNIGDKKIDDLNNNNDINNLKNVIDLIIIPNKSQTQNILKILHNSEQMIPLENQKFYLNLKETLNKHHDKIVQCYNKFTNKLFELSKKLNEDNILNIIGYDRNFIKTLFELNCNTLNDNDLEQINLTINNIVIPNRTKTQQILQKLIDNKDNIPNNQIELYNNLKEEIHKHYAKINKCYDDLLNKRQQLLKEKKQQQKPKRKRKDFDKEIFPLKKVKIGKMNPFVSYKPSIKQNIIVRKFMVDDSDTNLKKQLYSCYNTLIDLYDKLGEFPQDIKNFSYFKEHFKIFHNFLVENRKNIKDVKTNEDIQDEINSLKNQIIAIKVLIKFLEDNKFIKLLQNYDDLLKQQLPNIDEINKLKETSKLYVNNLEIEIRKNLKSESVSSDDEGDTEDSSDNEDDEIILNIEVLSDNNITNRMIDILFS